MILKMIPYLLVTAGFFFAFVIINLALDTARDNNTYVRYIACALSIPPEQRDRNLIHHCWEHVIEESGREVHRYDQHVRQHPWLND